MKNVEIFIGIDVSKATLDLIGINASGAIVLDHCQIENKELKIERFVKLATKKFKTQKIVFVFEDTGVYGMPLELKLSALELDYCKVPALEIHLSKGISRGKSDKFDSLSIAKYALTNIFKLQPTVIPEFHIMKLKSLYTQREKIVKNIKIFGSNKELEANMPREIVKEVERSNKSILKNLKKNLKLVDSQLLKLIESKEELRKNFNLLNSVPGIGTQTAIYLLIVTRGFTTLKDARKLACFAGVAPFPYQSGTSIKGRTKISHMADKKLKSLLSIAALSAKKYDHELKVYYERKVAEGKNKMLVMNNVRNKLLARAVSVVKRQEPYVNTRAFAA